MPLNILIYVDNFLEKSETFIINHIRSIKKLDNVLIVTEKIINSEFKEDLKIICIPAARKRRLIERLYSNRYTFLSYKNKEKTDAIRRIVNQFNPDIIHCHFGIQCLNFIHNFSNTEIPVFCTFHGYDVTKLTYISRAYRRALKALFNRTKLYPVFVCYYHMNYLENLSIKSEKSIVIYNGVDINFFKKSGNRTFNPDNPKYIQVSRLVDKKGHMFLLKAFATYILKKPNINFSLTVVGDGPLRQQLIDFVAEAGLIDHVNFVGWKTALELKLLLDEANYFIQPSITSAQNDQEATSITILEAMAMELPIIATKHAGIEEVVEDKKNGILVEENNVDQMVRALIEVRSFKSLEINRIKIVDSFNNKKQQKKLRDHYLDQLV